MNDSTNFFLTDQQEGIIKLLLSKLYLKNLIGKDGKVPISN